MVAVECRAVRGRCAVLCCGLTPPRLPQCMNTEPVATARQAFWGVLFQKAVLLTVICTVGESAFVNPPCAFSQTWKNWQLNLSAQCRICHSFSTNSFPNRPRRSPAYMWVIISRGENYHTKPCSSTAGFSLRYFLLCSQIVEVLKSCKFSCKRSVQRQGNGSDSIQGFLRNQYYAVDVYIKPIQ